MIETLWFCLVALLLTVYVMLDGFDLGAGAIHLLVAQTDEERKAVLHSVGPVFDGNEVWLVAAGGTLLAAFPVLYAASFQGFYLPLMIVLWLLMARGLSIELRHHLDAPLWRPLWDAGFALSSLTLTIVYGAALGNVVRGVPLDEAHEFFLPLWTSWTPAHDAGILDWYTMASGVTAGAALAFHGALWVRFKTAGNVRQRASRLAQRLLPVVALLTVGLSFLTFAVQPHIRESFTERPWGLVFPALAIGGLVVSRGDAELTAFLGSCAYLAGMLASAAFGLFPYVLPAVGGEGGGLTVWKAAAGAYSLHVAMLWWFPGIALAVAYSVFVYRRFAGKVQVS